MEKEGYEPILAVSSTFDIDISKQSAVIPYTIKRTLDKKESIPPGMVRVNGAKVQYLNIGDLPDFFIDRCEVTNKQFKEFINKGGYQKKEYWKHEFLKEGKNYHGMKQLQNLWIKQAGLAPQLGMQEISLKEKMIFLFQESVGMRQPHTQNSKEKVYRPESIGILLEVVILPWRRSAASSLFCCR